MGHIFTALRSLVGHARRRCASGCRKIRLIRRSLWNLVALQPFGVAKQTNRVEVSWTAIKSNDRPVRNLLGIVGCCEDEGSSVCELKEILYLDPSADHCGEKTHNKEWKKTQTHVLIKPVQAGWGWDKPGGFSPLWSQSAVSSQPRQPSSLPGTFIFKPLAVCPLDLNGLNKRKIGSLWFDIDLGASYCNDGLCCNLTRQVRVDLEEASRASNAGGHVLCTSSGVREVSASAQRIYTSLHMVCVSLLDLLPHILFPVCVCMCVCTYTHTFWLVCQA